VVWRDAGDPSPREHIGMHQSSLTVTRGGKPGRRRPVGNDYVNVERPYQSAWTAVPLCSVATVPLALHAIAADMSDQLSAASCQCRAIPAGDA